MTHSTDNLTGFRSQAFIGLGSNIDDPISHIQHAFQEIDEIADTSLVAISSLFETAPIGYDHQPAFINAVAKVETLLSPQALMKKLLDIELQHHRKRLEKNGPRTLDLDILLFNEWRIEEPMITVPHPRAHARAFVLIPLLEIAPDLYIPGIGYARDLLPQVVNQKIRRLEDVVIPNPAARRA
jgi:2-amino-4-hydroxy-6-hydroxymethyldihydropteridine diphosphokinase